jgi:site-specific DNA recombinase
MDTMKTAVIYARVSSDKQKDENTIASQTAALREFARQHGFAVSDEWVIEDEGYSGENGYADISPATSGN